MTYRELYIQQMHKEPESEAEAEAFAIGFSRGLISRPPFKLKTPDFTENDTMRLIGHQTDSCDFAAGGEYSAAFEDVIAAFGADKLLQREELLWFALQFATLGRILGIRQERQRRKKV